jgi:type IV pilus assembly protein PilB
MDNNGYKRLIMDNSEYLDFDEAVAFLKTTPSTLYKWLQAGKIPGHKLGRQWRFLRDELEIHVSGKGARISIHKDYLQLSEILNSRAKNKKESSMQAGIQQLTEQLIWDAYDHGARLIHVYPSKGKYEISYRTWEGMDKLTTVQEEFFREFDANLMALSSAIAEEDSRRLYMHREEGAADLQIRYQKIETVTGPRLTLRIWQPEKDVLPLDKIHGGDKTALENFKKWTEADHGIVIVTGNPGSGKTTTVYSLLNEFKNAGSVVFTIEESVEMVIDGVNQIELKSRKSEEFARVFEQISSSDPDVICLGLSSYYGNEEQVFSAAYEAASTGHMVIIQMSEETPQGAVDFMKKNIKYNIDPIIVGVSSQELIKIDGKYRVKYKFL